MIKSNVIICAEISRAAVMKGVKESPSFMSFSVSLPLEGRDGSKKNLEISVSADGDETLADTYTLGRRVNIEGSMTLRKHGEHLYFNVRAEK